MAIIAMKQCTISSTTELSFIFTALIWDSNVSDMKFGWLDLFASRMSRQPIQQENPSASDPNCDHVFCHDCHNPVGGGDGFVKPIGRTNKSRKGTEKNREHEQSSNRNKHRRTRRNETEVEEKFWPATTPSYIFITDRPQLRLHLQEQRLQERQITGPPRCRVRHPFAGGVFGFSFFSGGISVLESLCRKDFS
ncbi:hypothetical protein NC653_008140 [Populus alba x Populus x berolinensis]|uniref:Uncharacterized protein n=1 Tax=Populus alba x Populus x berolinensis TaxID=444605 RepID=A0AAD6W9L5_9ROSI|nr:hypothetical protein NC653_008140 [Populus alba x Populus x berolinensis]